MMRISLFNFTLISFQILIISLYSFSATPGSGQLIQGTVDFQCGNGAPPPPPPPPPPALPPPAPLEQIAKDSGLGSRRRHHHQVRVQALPKMLVSYFSSRDLISASNNRVLRIISVLYDRGSSTSLVPHN
ncbi:hypothetical protein LguiB_023186 [Lonicera macranthoides]